MTCINVELLKSNVEKLVNQRGESKTKALTNSGVGKDFFSNLNKGQIPSVEKIISLADYFGVSIDYLLGRTDNPNTIQKGVGLERGARVQIPLSALNLTEQASVRIFLFVNFEKMFLNFENFCVITYYITH